MSARIVSGTIAGSALTGSFQDVIASSAFLDTSSGGEIKLIIITSDLDQACLISLGSTGHPMRLPGGSSGIVIDLQASELSLSDAIQVKHDGAASGASTKLNVVAFMD